MVAVVIPSNLGPEFDIGGAVASKITIKPATATTAGKVALSVAASYPNHANDTTSPTPAYVKAAIDAAIAALPGDKFLQGLSSYNAATNVVTLLLNDGSTVPVDLTGLVNDAVASVPVATDTVQGKVALAVAANAPSPTNDQDAATPAYVAASIAAAAPSTPLTDAFAFALGTIYP